MTQNKTKSKGRRGRPPKEYVMTNGNVSAEDLFVFTPRETIPDRQVNRFLQLCDMMISEMHAEELTPSDIDAVAQCNKLRMFGDKICKDMAEQEITDISFITQLEKLHKQQEKHLENLKLRRKDRHIGKIGSTGKSLTELARELDDISNDRMEEMQKKSESEVEKFEENFADSDPSVFIENMGNRNEP